MPVTSIEAGEEPIHKGFSDQFAFTVPRYQRPYLWDEVLAEQLVDDLLDALDESAEQVDKLDPYFLGSILLVKDKGSPDAEVIDGQQRLATLTILLAALRVRLPSENVDLTKYLYEKGDRLLGTPNRYRLTLRGRDEDFFREFIQEENGLDQLQESRDVVLTDSRRHLRENAFLIGSRLSKLSDARSEQLAAFILKKCYLVVVSTPILDSAYRIFMVLNDRGLGLQAPDIIKAEVIGKIPEPEQNAYTQKWEIQEEELGRQQFEILFAHIRMIYRKAKLRGTTLKEIREYVKPDTDPRGFVDRILLPLSDALLDIQGEQYESTTQADQVNQIFSLLKLVDNSDWYPPAILYLSTHREKPGQLEQFFTDLERLAATMMIRRANINERIERYGRLLTAIEKRADLYSEPSPLQLSSDEKGAVLRALEGDIYNAAAIRLPVLLRLDRVLASGDASYDLKMVTVEHVLPQHPEPDGEWIEHFPDEEERKELTHCIGNLVLLSRRKNTQASNFEFERKKQEYFMRKGVSDFILTTEVLAEPAWTADVVRDRRERLVEKLRGTWRL